MSFYKRYYKTTTLILLASVLSLISYVQDYLITALLNSYCQYIAPHAEQVINQVIIDSITESFGNILV